MNKRSIGQNYEVLACTFLQGQGLVLLDKNVYARGGEIDLVMRDQDTLVFIEVRSRQDKQFGLAQESLTTRKIKNLIYCAYAYLYSHHYSENTIMRFDLVAFNGKQKPIWEKNIINLDCLYL